MCVCVNTKGKDTESGRNTHHANVPLGSNVNRGAAIEQKKPAGHGAAADKPVALQNMPVGHTNAADKPIDGHTAPSKHGNGAVAPAGQ